MKIWIVYENVESNSGKVGHYIYGIFDSEEKALNFQQHTKGDGSVSLDVEAYEVQ